MDDVGMGCSREWDTCKESGSFLGEAALSLEDEEAVFQKTRWEGHSRQREKQCRGLEVHSGRGTQGGSVIWSDQRGYVGYEGSSGRQAVRARSNSC